MRGFRIEIVEWTPEARGPLAAVRRAVFVVEQGVGEHEEWDGRDAECLHALARASTGEAIGCARLLPDARIGRMAVVREWRGRGVGSALLLALLQVALERAGPDPTLHAQEHALGFYRRLGFVARGPRFLDAGIAHREMVWRGTRAPRGPAR